MLRTPLFVAVIAIVFVAASGSAAASPQFAATFQINYTSKVPGTSSGLTGLATWTDPGEQFGKPAALKKIVFAFNPGTKFDTSALPACKATDQQVRALGVHACPANTVAGRGDTTGIATGGFPLTTVVSFFNAKEQIIVVVELNGKKLTFFRDDAKGATITANLVIPAGISLTKLHVVFPAHSSRKRHGKKKAGKKRAYLTTPTICPPSGVWTTNATFSYDNGFTHTLSSDTPCAASRAY